MTEAGVASQDPPTWNQISEFLRAMQRLRHATGFAREPGRDRSIGLPPDRDARSTHRFPLLLEAEPPQNPALTTGLSAVKVGKD